MGALAYPPPGADPGAPHLQGGLPYPHCLPHGGALPYPYYPDMPYPYAYPGMMAQGMGDLGTDGHRYRWVLNPEDIDLLEQVFEASPFPSRQVRMQLASHLQVRPRQVQVWFQNKRQRVKSRGESVPPQPVTSGGNASSLPSIPAALPVSLAAGSTQDLTM